MIIILKNKGPLYGAIKKNIISNIKVDKPGIFSAYLLFNGRKKDHFPLGGNDE